ncbi:uncharacterized protein J7T54_007954 [Emericellopsis cladophorae]|uniref:Ribosomal protein L1 n=1 Tax=Emericellopsis cladophorae TaxID=2686198 RepID=A0A9P9Y8C6_9HYPO|nr:uncharacterized protein J7T54_007954 [Emericellopsis cladophorae]KAI6784860.1 hypothetical protein J7T54_007954 [Emericellopsis cladophorae]
MAPSKELVAVGEQSLVKIDPDQTLKASKALISHIKKASQQKATESNKRNLLDDEEGDADAEDTPIWLTLTTKRHVVDKPRLQPGKITLPHPLNTDESTTICLITADPQRAYKDIVDNEEFPEDLRKRITRVIDFTKLKAKFSQYEAQRKLYSEHDLFLADDRIITRIPKVLGKTFFKSQLKRPIPVILQPKGSKVAGKRKRPGKEDGQVNAASPTLIAKEITRAIGSALVSLSPATNTAVKIGYSGMTPEQIADNVDAVATALVQKWVPQQWRNVRSIYIKGPESAALPIWMTDELWLNETDVVVNGPDDLEGATEKANVGKKRKTLKGETEEPVAKKTKKAKKEVETEGDDDKLDVQIAERKSSLRKQKAAARKSID